MTLLLVEPRLSPPFKDLQSSLMARSSEVNSVAFDIQVFISERAQDLAPEQSRQLLGHLQQLQRTFHRTSGQAQAWADALSAQKEREAEWQRREKEKEEEDREKQSARATEVWKMKTECTVSQNCICHVANRFSVLTVLKTFAL